MDASTLAEFKSQLEKLQRELQQWVSADESSDKVELDQSRMGRLSRMDALQHQQMSLDRLRFDPTLTRCIDCAEV